MQIAVTGATGDIGGSYIKSLNTKHHTLKVLKREGGIENVHRLDNVYSYSFKDNYIYESAFLDDFTQSDALVHFAGLLNSKECKRSDTFAVNAFLTGALTMSISRNNSDTKFVYISSEMVYTIPYDFEISSLANRFIIFCKQNLTENGTFNLYELAQRFILQNDTFPFEQYNDYALSKYLGEVISGILPDTTILRVSNAYGPDYGNLRLIPRMIIARLTGHSITYTDESRDFIYSSDINNLITKVITDDIRGTVDCNSGEAAKTTNLANYIIKATPTAYGELVSKTVNIKRPTISIPRADKNTKAIIGKLHSFEDGLASTIRHHKEQTYHQMNDSRSIYDFLESGEKVVRKLKGSSAAHLFVTVDRRGTKRVRKIAIYDGVEGNGIAKVANEIAFYEHITANEPSLALMYPRLLDSKTDDTYASLTIEYLPGKNFYEAIKDSETSLLQFEKSYSEFINILSVSALTDCNQINNSEKLLDAYYIERSLTRLHPAKEFMKVEDEVIINGQKYVAPHVILSELLTDKKLRNILLPRTESICFHGDMTLLNTVFLGQVNAIKLIDPRGHIGRWDPLYDFAKLQFTLSGFGELVVGKKPMVIQEGNHYIIQFGNIPDNAKLLHQSLFDILLENKIFANKIIQHEPYWKQRITFAEASHFLADIPFRLYTDETTETALASYMMGTYYLNKVYERLKNEIS